MPQEREQLQQIVREVYLPPLLAGPRAVWRSVMVGVPRLAHRHEEGHPPDVPTRVLGVLGRVCRRVDQEGRLVEEHGADAEDDEHSCDSKPQPADKCQEGGEEEVPLLHPDELRIPREVAHVACDHVLLAEHPAHVGPPVAVKLG